MLSNSPLIEDRILDRKYALKSGVKAFGEGFSVSVPGLPVAGRRARRNPKRRQTFGRLTIPRNNPVNAYTMAGIVRDAGMTLEEFRKLL